MISCGLRTATKQAQTLTHRRVSARTRSLRYRVQVLGQRIDPTVFTPAFFDSSAFQVSEPYPYAHHSSTRCAPCLYGSAHRRGMQCTHLGCLSHPFEAHYASTPPPA